MICSRIKGGLAASIAALDMGPDSHLSAKVDSALPVWAVRLETGAAIVDDAAPQRLDEPIAVQ
jgi:hypothetical protein